MLLWLVYVPNGWLGVLECSRSRSTGLGRCVTVVTHLQRFVPALQARAQGFGGTFAVVRDGLHPTPAAFADDFGRIWTRLAVDFLAYFSLILPGPLE